MRRDSVRGMFNVSEESLVTHQRHKQELILCCPYCLLLSNGVREDITKVVLRYSCARPTGDETTHSNIKKEPGAIHVRFIKVFKLKVMTAEAAKLQGLRVMDSRSHCWNRESNFTTQNLLQYNARGLKSTFVWFAQITPC